MKKRDKKKKEKKKKKKKEIWFSNVDSIVAIILIWTIYLKEMIYLDCHIIKVKEKR